MTHRDLCWRAAGLALVAAGCVAGSTDVDGSPWTLLYFLAAILGIVLMVNGKRVSTVWKAERRGHRDTATIIHAQRLRRRADVSRADTAYADTAHADTPRAGASPD